MSLWLIGQGLIISVVPVASSVFIQSLLLNDSAWAFSSTPILTDYSELFL